VFYRHGNRPLNLLAELMLATAAISVWIKHGDHDHDAANRNFAHCRRFTA
jgi:hypothetical protein